MSPAETAAMRLLATLVENGNGSALFDDWRSACIDGYEVSAAETRTGRRTSFNRIVDNLSRKHAILRAGDRVIIERPADWQIGGNGFDESPECDEIDLIG